MHFFGFLADITASEINHVLDIGSRDAEEAKVLADHFCNATIHAFEPNPPQYRTCVATATPYPRIKVSQLALSDKEGELDFYVAMDNVGASSLLKPTFIPHVGHNKFEVIKVPCVTLDSWCEQNNVQPEILWMDVQGNELNVLKGAVESLKTVKAIATEVGLIPYYEGHTMRDDILKFLEEQGFELVNETKAWSHEADVILKRKK